MWDTLSKPWQACIEQAWEAYCAGSIPIGAVIVDQHGEIISRARNRRYEEDGFPFGAKNQEVMHAELQAILAMDDRQVTRDTAELYTTMEPCPMCLGTWFMSNMRVLHFAARDPYAGSADLLETTWYMRLKGKLAFGPADPGLEDILIALSVETEVRLAKNFSPLLRSRWEPVLPRGIQLGEILVEDPQLAAMRENQTPVSEAIDYLIIKRESANAHR